MDQYGFVKHSLVDYPGEVSSVIFFPGCNLSCPYCHNQELIVGNIEEPWSLKDILAYLSKVTGKLITAVCITGGEPTLNEVRLLQVVDEIKKIRLKVKLDTNGSNPKLLEKIQVDYVAMDVKTSLKNYQTFSNDPLIDEKILKSIEIIQRRWKKSNHQFRTTMFPKLTAQECLQEIKELVGESTWKQQKYIPV